MNKHFIFVIALSLLNLIIIKNIFSYTVTNGSTAFEVDNNGSGNNYSDIDSFTTNYPGTASLTLSNLGAFTWNGSSWDELNSDDYSVNDIIINLYDSDDNLISSQKGKSFSDSVSAGGYYFSVEIDSSSVIGAITCNYTEIYPYDSETPTISLTPISGWQTQSTINIGWNTSVGESGISSEDFSWQLNGDTTWNSIGSSTATKSSIPFTC